MRFTDLLRAGSLLGAASATALAAAAVAFGAIDGQQETVLLSTAWWIVAATGAMFASRTGEANASIARLMADARPLKVLPEPSVARTLANRLWPVALATLMAIVGTALLGAQIAGIAVGFPLAWALLWHAQESAVKAVEERDGVSFHVAPTSPVQPIRLLRGPGLRRDRPREADAKRAPTT